MFDLPFDRKPDYVNEEGTKWWKDNGLTDYAVKPNDDGICLPDIKVWFIELDDGSRERVITNDRGVGFASTLLENILTHIDFLKMKKYFSDKDKIS